MKEVSIPSIPASTIMVFHHARGFQTPPCMSTQPLRHSLHIILGWSNVERKKALKIYHMDA